MKDEEEKKIQNQEDEILNPQEEETVEGGVSDLQDGHGTSEVPLDGGVLVVTASANLIRCR